MSGPELRDLHTRFLAAEPAAAWLNAERELALERFLRAGFPRPGDEDWKYTRIDRFESLTLDHLAERPPRADAAAQRLLDDLPLPDGGLRIVIANGRVGELPREPAAGLALGSLATAAPDERAAIATRLELSADPELPSLAALNAAFLSDLLHIRVAAGARPGLTLQVVHVAAGETAAIQDRVLVELGEGSELTLIEHFLGRGAVAVNAVTELHAAAGAACRYIRVQEAGPDCQQVTAQSLRLAEDSRAEVVDIALGASLARNDLHVDLAGRGARADIHGLLHSTGGQHSDCHLRIDHRAGDSNSRAAFRGVVGGRSRGVFNGKIIVHGGADGSDASLENRNLLLDRQAEIDTKPELEIYTDDVKCSHGATTGQLDAAAVFYLRSRGVAEADARRLLMLAFAGAITARLPAGGLRERVEACCSERVGAAAEAAA